MTREEKIEAIYKEMANKELTLGCKVKFNKGIYSIIDRENVGFLDSYKGKYGDIHNTIVIEDRVNSRCYSIQKIIGHPVMIGDMLERYRTNNNGYKYLDIDPYDLECYYDPQIDDIRELLSIWADKRTPIEDQSDECIDYVYILIQKY